MIPAAAIVGCALLWLGIWAAVMAKSACWTWREIQIQRGWSRRYGPRDRPGEGYHDRAHP